MSEHDTAPRDIDAPQPKPQTPEHPPVTPRGRLAP